MSTPGDLELPSRADVAALFAADPTDPDPTPAFGLTTIPAGSPAARMLRADLAVPGTALEVEVFGDRLRAEGAGFGAQWDPANERLRACPPCPPPPAR
ncbi:hypothetical protein [Raoultella terrigena]|uniref:hypothetical protein n=1 Tax=Raoultella terrigena TaxID=577 RepID=UPI001330A495|nr:hypothetical protein [Raoultella terrigena]